MRTYGVNQEFRLMLKAFRSKRVIKSEYFFSEIYVNICKAFFLLGECRTKCMKDEMIAIEAAVLKIGKVIALKGNEFSSLNVTGM